MSEKASILSEELEWAVGSLKRVCKDLGEEEYKWKPTEVSNSVQWQLLHISRIINIALPRIIKGIKEYTPEGWPDDYNERDFPHERVMEDIVKGKEFVVENLREIGNEAMDEEIPLWGGTRLLKEGLFAYIGEVFHHKGQVAYVRGTYKRLKG